MRFLARHLFVAVVAIAMTASIAWGKVKTETVTLASDVMINGTPVKAGEYRVRFDDQTNDLEILKGNKVVVKTTAHMAPRADKARGTMLHLLNNDLVSITFGGEREDLVIGTGNSQSGS